MSSQILYNIFRALLFYQFPSDRIEIHVNLLGWEKREQVCINFIFILGNNLMNFFCSEHFPPVCFILTISLILVKYSLSFYTHVPF